MPVPFSHQRRQDQPEALLSYIEKRIKQAVVSGELKPGAKLSPSAVAADLGVSHIPVREALTSLAASGYLEHKPRVGFFVRVLSSEDLADIYHWREVLEREAFTMAIPWDAAAPYTFTGLVDIDEAQHDHERMMDLFEAHDVDGVIEMMTRHRGLAVEAAARWEACSRS